MNRISKLVGLGVATIATATSALVGGSTAQAAGWLQYDLNNDGYYDLAGVDLDGDGAFDQILLDADKNRTWDVYLYFTGNWSYIWQYATRSTMWVENTTSGKYVWIDSESNGAYEWVGFSNNGDLNAEWFRADDNRDGHADSNWTQVSVPVVTTYPQAAQNTRLLTGWLNIIHNENISWVSSR